MSDRSPRVVHIPDAGKGNPYQRNLCDALSEQGTTAIPVDPDRPIVFAALRAARRHDTDVVHFHWLHAFYYGDNLVETAIKSVAFAVELLVLRLLGIRLVWTAHNVVPHNAEWRRFHVVYRRAFVRRCGCVVVHCERAADRIVEAYGLSPADRDRVAVVPHGNYADNYPTDAARPEARASLGLPEDGPVFLFFGQLRPYKGVEELVRTFDRTAPDDATLLVAGDPSVDSYRETLEALVERTDGVRLDAGYVPTEEVSTYFRAADAVTLPYRDILTSGSAMLALTFGRPPVVPDIGCNRELLGPDAAVLYDPDDGVERGLETALSADLDAKGEAASRRAAELSWDGIAARTREVYRRLGPVGQNA